MNSKKVFSIAFVLIVLASIAQAQQPKPAATSQPAIIASDANKTPPLPYIAQITSDNVQVRSGPGTNFYVCGKITKNDMVKVVSQQHGWSGIVPPPSCYSWIAKQYVKVDTADPCTGTLTGDNVRIRAGHEDGNPLHSDFVQGTLNSGEKVRLLGVENNEYYKIVPPPFAYMWISTQYTKPLGSTGIPAIVIPKQETIDINSSSTAVEQNVKELQQYYTLEALVKAELAKPSAEQNFTSIKEALTALAENKNAGKAARYAQAMLKRIEGFQLAAKATKAMELQDKELAQTKDKIEKAYSEKISELPNLGRFASIGKFRPSVIHGKETVVTHYQLVDSSGKIICFAVPSGPLAKTDLSKFVDKKVGLVGKIVPDSATSSASIQFIEVVEVK